MKKFPEVVYVKVEEAGTDDEYLVADQSAEFHAELGKTVEVAVYRLEKVAKLVTKAELVADEEAPPKKTRAKKAAEPKQVDVEEVIADVTLPVAASPEAAIANLAAAVVEGLNPAPAKTYAEAQAVLEKLFAAKGIEVARETLMRFGVQKLQNMKPEQYGAFVRHAEKVMAGGEV